MIHLADRSERSPEIDAEPKTLLRVTRGLHQSSTGLYLDRSCLIDIPGLSDTSQVSQIHPRSFESHIAGLQIETRGLQNVPERLDVGAFTPFAYSSYANRMPLALYLIQGKYSELREICPKEALEFGLGFGLGLAQPSVTKCHAKNCKGPSSISTISGEAKLKFQYFHSSMCVMHSTREHSARNATRMGVSSAEQFRGIARSLPRSHADRQTDPCNCTGSTSSRRSTLPRRHKMPENRTKPAKGPIASDLIVTKSIFVLFPRN